MKKNAAKVIDDVIDAVRMVNGTNGFYKRSNFDYLVSRVKIMQKVLDKEGLK